MPRHPGALLRLRHALGQRFPHLLRHEPGQVVRLRFEQAGEPFVHPPPLGERRPPPVREDPLRALQRDLDLAGRRGVELGQQFLGRGVQRSVEHRPDGTRCRPGSEPRPGLPGGLSGTEVHRVVRNHARPPSGAPPATIADRAANRTEVPESRNRRPRPGGRRREADLETRDSTPVAAQWQALRALRDGWLDGEGVAPPPEGLDRFAARFDEDYPERLPPPYIYTDFRRRRAVGMVTRFDRGECRSGPGHRRSGMALRGSRFGRRPARRARLDRSKRVGLADGPPRAARRIVFVKGTASLRRAARHAASEYMAGESRPAIRALRRRDARSEVSVRLTFTSG